MIWNYLHNQRILRIKQYCADKVFQMNINFRRQFINWMFEAPAICQMMYVTSAKCNIVMYHITQKLCCDKRYHVIRLTQPEMCGGSICVANSIEQFIWTPALDCYIIVVNRPSVFTGFEINITIIFVVCSLVYNDRTIRKHCFQSSGRLWHRVHIA